MKRKISLILVFIILMCQISVLSANEEIVSSAQNTDAEGLNETLYTEGFTVLPGYTEDNITYNVKDESDGEYSTDFNCENNSKRLLYGYNFKAGRVYLVNIKMRTVSGSGSVTCSVIRPEGLPAREFLGNRMSVSEEYKTYTMYYKCGDDSIEHDKPVPGYISFYVDTKDITLRIRSVSIREVSNAYYPTNKLPYEASKDVTENKDIITRLTFNGYMYEREQGFCPNAAITRNELVQGIISVGGYSADSYNGCFSDVTSATPYSGYIQKAYNLGIIGGNTFSPYENADYTFLKALSEKIYTVVSGKALPYEEMGNIDLSGKSSITRAEAAIVLNNLLEKIRNERLEAAFIDWAENAITVYEEKGMTQEAESFSAELEEWKENTVVTKQKDSGYMIAVNDFYKNPASKRILNEIIKCGIYASGYKYIKVGDDAKKSFTVYTAPASTAGQMECLLWGMLNEDSPYCGNTYALTYVLSNLEILSYIVNEGNSQYYFTKQDSNYNMFFFQIYMYSYLLMKEYYPCFILPSMAEKIEKIIDDAIKYQEQYNSKNGSGYYANVDVMLANMYAYAGRILNNNEYLKKADEIINNVSKTVFDDGGIPYIGSENEIAVYHNNILKDVGMNYMVTKSEAAYNLLKKTVNYYPVTLDNNLYTDSSTALVFKQNWSSAGIMPGVTVAAYFEEGGKNKAIEQKAFSEDPYMLDTAFEGALVTGAYYDYGKSADETVFSDGLTEDKNIGGARGKFGNFSYTLDFRNRRLREGYPVDFPGNGMHKKGTYAGKSSYVGVSFTESGREDGLVSAVGKVYSTVKHSNTGKKYADRTNVSNYSDEWFENGEDYAAGGATYSIGTYGAAAMSYENLDGFIGHEMWYGERDRLVGVLMTEAVDDTQIYDQNAVIQLIEGSSNTYDVKESVNLTENEDGTYSYGNIGIKIHQTNYSGMTVDFNAKVMNTAINSGSSKDAVEIVFGEGENTLHTVKSGDRKYIVVEFYNEENTDALEDVGFNEYNGVFEMQVSGRTVCYNLSEQNIVSDGKIYSHGSGGVFNSYVRENGGVTPKSFYEKDFDEEVYTVGDKGYYTGDSKNNSANNVLFYDSSCDTTTNPTSHFEVCEENGEKYLKFKVRGMNNKEAGTVKSYFLQFSNLNNHIPFGKMLYEGTDTSPEKFSFEFDMRCPKESYNTALRFEFYQNTEGNQRGKSTSLTFKCGVEDFGEDWVHHKLIFDKRARKIYLYRDNCYSGEFAVEATLDLFRNGINLIRIYYRGENSNGTFVKDGVEREISVDNFKISVPEITYRTAAVSANDNFCVNLEILNNTFEKRTVKLICAVYKGEKLEDVRSLEDILVNPGETETVDRETVYEEGLEGKSIKLFLWDDFNGMKPLEDVIY